jgi:hypothetical protein
METKTCKDCGETKPWDKTKPRESEANGWVGMFCFACYTIRRRVKRTGSPELVAPSHDEAYAHWQPVSCAPCAGSHKRKDGTSYKYEWIGEKAS